MIYLYVKQHTITGLKYFGKTECDDPYAYTGSGTYWTRHINKHGRDHIDTLQLWSFNNIDECTEFALQFSRENNIVESDEWANLREENGRDGNPRGIVFSEEARQNMSKSRTGRKLSPSHIESIRQSHLGVSRSEATKSKIAEKLRGRKASEETRLKMSKTRAGRKLPPRSEEYKQKQREIQTGLKQQPRSADHCSKLSADKLGKRYYNNGMQQIFTRDTPPDGWVRGRLKKTHQPVIGSSR